MRATLPIFGQSSPSASVTPDRIEPEAFRGRAAVVTLGCAKNQVDSEVMLGVFARAGYELVSQVEEADVVVVNTCGFLESSVRESLDCILDVSELKTAGRLRKLIVSGCLVERYRGELASELPEVDAFLTTDQLISVGDAADGPVGELFRSAARPYFLYDDTTPRVLSHVGHSAYVKVSEGCDRPCSFCIIPKIRGAMRSREIASVVREVQQLEQEGVREVNLVAQDLTDFGRDRKSEGLTDLLQALAVQTSIDWIRLLYAYPLGIDASLLRTIVDLPSVCSYLDFPLQHSSERILRDMRRPLGKYTPRKMLELIRAVAPEIEMRTTFIVGFPGETEEDVRDLEDFIREGQFTSVGIFEYSQEEGTPAGGRSDQISSQEKQARREHLMFVQQEMVTAKLDALIGSRHRVLIEGKHEETELLLVGRAAFQAPEVDGQVIINDLSCDVPQDSSRLIGTFAEVEMTERAGYDLVGQVVSLEAQ